MQRPNYRKLKKLALFLQQLKPKRFDFNNWVGDNWRGKKDLSCGTTACAVGWATTVFPRTVYAFKLDGVAYICHKDQDQSTFNRNNCLEKSIEAAALLFNISYNDATSLFIPQMTAPWAKDETSPRPKATPKQVAQHILGYIDWKKKQPK